MISRIAYREENQNISLIHKLVNRWRNLFKTVLFTFLNLLMTLKRPATGVRKNVRSADF